MTIFSSTLGQMTFLFLIIAVGYILRKANALPPNSAQILAKLENTVFIPALVLGTFIKNFRLETLSTTWKLLVFSSALLVIIIPLAIFIPRLVTKDSFRRKIYTYGLSFSNFSFMGNAVVAAVFPDLLDEYIIFTLPLWIGIYMWGAPTLLIPSKGGSFASRLKGLLNPMFIAMVIGIIIGFANIPIPHSVISVIETLGDCMSPIAMLLTGMTVACISLRSAFMNLEVYIISAVRLLVIPLVFIGIFALIRPPYYISICAICSIVMPLGLNTIVIPSAYGKDPTAAASMSLVSHLIACITIPLMLMLFTTIFA